MLQRLPGAHHIADYLLATAKLDHDIELDQLQLNKLCYLVNGFTLQERDAPAFHHDVEAWRHGPVVPVVYKMYKDYGSRPITQLELCRTSLRDHKDVVDRWVELVKIIGEDVAAIASSVLAKYGKCDGGQLVGMTHMTNTPWKKAYKSGRNNIISTETIKQFYRNLSADDRGR